MALPTPEELAPGTVIHVSDMPTAAGMITLAEFRHALVQAAVQGGREQVPASGTRAYERLEHTAVHALIETAWLKGQGAEMGIVVSQRQIARKLVRLKQESFDSEAEYREFLREARYTRRDVDERVELQLLSERIQRRIVTGVSSRAEERKVLNEFVAAYNERWRARTVCAPRYAMYRCSNGPELPG